MGGVGRFALTLLLCTASILSEKFTATMPGAYPQKADDYICTRIPLSGFKNRPGYVTAFKPIVNASVHHIILSACNEWLEAKEATRPGPCVNQCRTHIMYAWAHNGAPLVLPEGSAFEIGRSTQIKSLAMEVHYSRPEENPDYASIELTYTRQPQINRAGIILLYNDDATIPPHAQHFPTNISCRLHTDVPIRIIAIRTHAHDLNRGVYGYYYRPKDRHYHLMAKGNAKWPQTFYKPSQLSAGTDSIRLQQGDILMGRCVYDSTNRDTPTSMGSTHADEMCNLYLMYTMDSRFNLLDESELCADEMVPGVWDNAPPEALEYVSDTPPAKAPEPPTPSIPRSIDFLPDPHWSIRGVRPGAVSGIALADGDEGRTHLFVLRRGENPWNEFSFDDNLKYNEPEATFVDSPILHVDAQSGKLLDAFGDDLLILPHGLSVARDASGKPTALWVTDLALHQVMKFDWSEWTKPSLVLGKRGQAGDDRNSFCKPADVAVASTGEVFVADGYCNQRVVKFSSTGDYLAEWGVGGIEEEEEEEEQGEAASEKGFLVTHSITVVPASPGGVEQVCVADRERAQIDCYDLHGRRIAQYGGHVLSPSVYAVSFSPVYRLLFGVTGPVNDTPSTMSRLQAILGVGEEDEDEDYADSVGNSVFAFRPFLATNSTRANQTVYRAINDRAHLLEVGLQSPHDVEVSADGSVLFVAQLRFPYLTKIDIVNSDKAGAGVVQTIKSGGGEAAAFGNSPTYRSLKQKMLVTGSLVTLCAVVAIIALVLIGSRRSQPWAWPTARLQRRPGHRRSKWKRYDGFQPLRQDQAHGVDSAFERDVEDDDDEEETVADSDTIIDVRKFGPPESGQTFSASLKSSIASPAPHLQTRMHTAASVPSHHIDT